MFNCVKKKNYGPLNSSGYAKQPKDIRGIVCACSLSACPILRTGTFLTNHSVFI